MKYRILWNKFKQMKKAQRLYDKFINDVKSQPINDLRDRIIHVANGALLYGDVIDRSNDKHAAKKALEHILNICLED